LGVGGWGFEIRVDGLCVSCKALHGLCVSCRALRRFVCVLQSAMVCVCPAKRCDGLCVSCKALRCVCPAKRCAVCVLQSAACCDASVLEGVIDSRLVGTGRGTTRTEDAQGTPIRSHVSPTVLVYEDKCFCIRRQMFLYTKTNVFVYEDKCFCVYEDKCFFVYEDKCFFVYEEKCFFVYEDKCCFVYEDKCCFGSV